MERGKMEKEAKSSSSAKASADGESQRWVSSVYLRAPVPPWRNWATLRPPKLWRRWKGTKTRRGTKNNIQYSTLNSQGSSQHPKLLYSSIANLLFSIQFLFVYLCVFVFLWPNYATETRRH
jgi:hypothetical protein